MDCPSCGQTIEDNLQNCPHCHADVEAGKATVDLDKPLSDPQKGIETADQSFYAGGTRSAVFDLKAEFGLSEGITLEGAERAEEAEGPRDLRELISGDTRDDRYIVGEELSRGGMGAILNSLDKDIRRQVAMKVMLDKGRPTKERIERFIEEAQVTGQLEHPNIVPIHELGTDNQGRLYFTMKMVHGKSLGEVLDGLAANDPLTLMKYTRGELLNIFLKVCDGVAFAHSRGVIHRDIKPDNLMVGEFGEVLVMDWGLAKIKGGHDAGTDEAISSLRDEEGFTKTVDGMVAGTPSYMPPEQAEGKIDLVDERSDVYALGALLYELLALVPPFTGDSVTAIINKVVKGRAVPPDKAAPDRDIPKELSAICMKAMYYSQRGRYQSVTELTRDLRNFLEDREVSVCPDTMGKRLVKWARRNRTLAAGLGVLIGAGLVGAIIILALVSRHARSEYVLARQNAELADKKATAEAARAAAEADRAEAEAKKALAEREKAATERKERLATEKLLGLEKKERERLQNRTEALSLYAKAASLANRGKNFEEAVKTFTKAVELDPTLANAYRERGLAYSQLGKPDDAIADFMQVDRLARAATGKGDPEALCFIAQVHRDVYRDKDTAVTWFRKADEIGTDDPHVRIARLNALYLDGKWTQAVDEARDVLNEYPAMYEAYFLMGMMLYEKGKRDRSDEGDKMVLEAAASFEKAYKLRPRDPDPYMNRGAALVHLGSKNNDKDKLDLGLRHYTMAVHLQPYNTKNRLLRFKINYQMKDWVLCEEDISALKYLLPEQPNIWEAAATLHEAMGQYKKALEEISKAVELAPNVPKYAKFRADMQGKVQEQD